MDPDVTLPVTQYIERCIKRPEIRVAPDDAHRVFIYDVEVFHACGSFVRWRYLITLPADGQ